MPASHRLNESLSVSAGIPTIDNTLNLHLDSKDVGKATEIVIQSTLFMKFYVMLCFNKKDLSQFLNANELH